MGDDDTQGPVVIVGAGQAGAWVATTLRERAPDRPVTLIGDEAHPPYERPPLSKAVLSGESPPESTWMRDPSAYAGTGITLLTGRRVTGIDRQGRTVALDDGTRLPWGRLVLATGARPRRLDIPGADHPRLRMLRTIDDAAALAPLLRPGARLVAIGAGFIGLEVAAVAATAGCAVTVLERAPTALARVMAPKVAARIVALHADRGVTIRCGAEVAAIEDADGAAAVVLADGTRLVADAVLAGIGAVPNDDLARAAGLDCDDGIVTDAHGRTSDPAILAAGDATRHFNPLLGRHLRLESWQNAQNQGIAVGRTLAGEDAPHAEIPWFWSDQFDLNIQMIGVPATWDEVIWRGEAGATKGTAIYLAQGRVVAGNTLNNGRDIRFLRELVRRGVPVSPAQAADPAVRLKDLATAQADT